MEEVAPARNARGRGRAGSNPGGRREKSPSERCAPGEQGAARASVGSPRTLRARCWRGPTRG